MLDHGVQAFFYGHDHVFVDDVVDGIHYALPGSFGAPWHFGPETTGYARFWGDSGHARLSVSPREARVDYINQTGSVFHSFTMAPIGAAESADRVPDRAGEGLWSIVGCDSGLRGETLGPKSASFMGITSVQ
jgi:hypothetical protein